MTPGPPAPERPADRRRVVLLGNAGAGKTTMARALAAGGLAHLDLDAIAWGAAAVRRPLAESVAALEAFARRHPAWVVEGSYGDLAAAALPLATELRWLDPGTDACVAHCLRRPWEREKYPSPEAQDARLSSLLDWVRAYDTRRDAYGRAYHRALYDAFRGPKRGYGAPDAERA